MADRSARIKLENSIGQLVNPATDEKLDAVIAALGAISGTALYDSRLDDGSTYLYVGEANPGTANSSTGWRIKRYTQSDLTGKWADATSAFTKIWDNRATYTY